MQHGNRFFSLHFASPLQTQQTHASTRKQWHSTCVHALVIGGHHATAALQPNHPSTAARPRGSSCLEPALTDLHHRQVCYSLRSFCKVAMSTQSGVVSGAAADRHGPCERVFPRTALGV
jgi:hypothetical protein